MSGYVPPLTLIIRLEQEISSMSSILGRAAVMALVVALGACSDYGSTQPDYNTPVTPVLFSASGDVAAKVDAFRVALGDPHNTTAGEEPAGRREINWDGAGANPFNNRNDFPATFFNTNVKAGAVFTTPGTGFRNDSLKFAEINAEYATDFSAFSPTKIFSPIGSNVMDVLFQVAGQPTPATVTGFGAIFSDVDLPEATSIELFDVNGKSLAVVKVPARSDAAGLSFAAAKFDSPIVARVRITLGTGSLGANVKDISAGGTADLVVVDNFLYGEPKRIP
jgi:hypothetical protein